MRFCLALLALTGAAAAQTFEVATIKPSEPNQYSVSFSGGPGTKDPEMFQCGNCTLSMLIGLCYRVAGPTYSGPQWAENAHFDLNAKLAPGASMEQMLIMLQNLLVERFQLKFHHETKEVHGYALALTKSGPKLRPSPATADETPSPPPVDFDHEDADGFPILPPGRTRIMLGHGDRMLLRLANASAQTIASELAGITKQPVTDSTGLTGNYDLILKWTSADPNSPNPGPTIFKAIQDQLGLKLEPHKTSIDLFVVDHLEKTPIAN